MEQIAAASGWRMGGATKMAQAREKFRALAGRMGLKLTDDHINQLLEAAADPSPGAGAAPAGETAGGVRD